MKKIITSTTLLLLAFGGKCIADEELEIKIVDESDKSALFQKGKIIGCTDFSLKKEESCAKKPKDVILDKLPSSSQISDEDVENEAKSKEIQEQLLDIIRELKQLKQEQKENRETIKELKSLVKVLATKNAPKKVAILKKGIKHIQKKKSPKNRATLIRKPIKEISRTNSEVIVEVQNNESLSTYAQAYYGNNRLYYRIYKANKDKIPSNLQITIGTHLRIPLD